MLLEPFLPTDISESVLHGYAVCSYHAVCINVDNVDVIERLYKVGTCDDLAGFVERHLGQGELVRGLGGILAKDKGACENDSCGLGGVSREYLLILGKTYTEFLLLLHVIVHSIAQDPALVEKP
jgi:hypothetical protein